MVFAALDDQALLRDQYLENAQSLNEVLDALIFSYVDWVSEQPQFAKFLMLAHFRVMQSEHRGTLNEKNKLRNRKIITSISAYSNVDLLKSVPSELVMSLVIGATESYCRVWLSKKVMTSPKNYRKILAKAAWDSLQNLADDLKINQKGE